MGQSIRLFVLALGHKMGLLKENICICQKEQDLVCLTCIYHAILVVVYLINKMPLKIIIFHSPLEALKGKNEYTIPPKVFECAFFVHTRNSGKLDPRTQKCFKCYHPASSRSFVSMYVTSREFEPYFSITLSPLHEESSKEEKVILPSFITGLIDDIVIE